jgi:hypothetical protein
MVSLLFIEPACLVQSKQEMVRELVMCVRNLRCLYVWSEITQCPVLLVASIVETKHLERLYQLGCTRQAKC